MSGRAGRRYVIGITDYVKPPFDIEAREFEDEVEFIALEAECEDAMAKADLARCDALLVWHMPITEKTISSLARCKIVVRYGVGYDLVDVAALQRSGIPFCNTPDYGIDEVADTAVAMMLSLQRRIFEYDIRAKEIVSGWQEHVLSPLPRFSECTVGVVGVGRIGSAVVRRLSHFGVRIVGFDPYVPSGHEKAIGYSRVHDLGSLLRQSDVVTLHVPLTDATRGMVDDRFISSIKRGAILVNTARGALVGDTDLLLDALRSGHLSAIGLDVLPHEPPPPSLLVDAWRSGDPETRGRILINPHTAYFSDSAWPEMRSSAAATVAAFLNDGIARNRVDPPG